MIDAITSALAGLNAASQKVNKSAEAIAKIGTDLPGADTVDLSEEAVNLKLAETSYRANVATLRVADDLSKELFKIFDKKV